MVRGVCITLILVPEVKAVGPCISVVCCEPPWHIVRGVTAALLAYVTLSGTELKVNTAKRRATTAPVANMSSSIAFIEAPVLTGLTAA